MMNVVTNPVRVSGIRLKAVKYTFDIHIPYDSNHLTCRAQTGESSKLNPNETN